MARSDNKRLRIAMYTHDTYGLGHVRRCLRIAEAICSRLPNASILLISGCPLIHVVHGRLRHLDYLKIPTVVQSGDERDQPSHLGLGGEETIALRSKIIRSAMIEFAPDMLLVDTFPLGTKRELLPTLKELRNSSCTVVLGLRDIVNRPEIVKEHWCKNNVYEALQNSFDRILVYGDRNHFDVVKGYALPPKVASKVRYCGYIGPNASTDPGTKRPLVPGLRSPFALATVGGGGDGAPLIRTFLEATQLISDLSAVVIMGPMMGKSARRDLHELANTCKSARIVDSVPDLSPYLKAAKVVVSMGGYNTVMELLAHNCAAVIVPRDWKYGEHLNRENVVQEYEQVFRAEILARAGLATYLHPSELSAHALAAKIQEAAALPQRVGASSFNLDGAEKASEYIAELIGD